MWEEEKGTSAPVLPGGLAGGKPVLNKCPMSAETVFTLVFMFQMLLPAVLSFAVSGPAASLPCRDSLVHSPEWFVWSVRRGMQPLPSRLPSSYTQGWLLSGVCCEEGEAASAL